MKEYSVIILGKIEGSGKMSTPFLRKLLSNNFDRFEIFHILEINQLSDFLDRNNSLYKKIIIFPIYREAWQAYLRKISKKIFCRGTDFAKETYEVSKNYKNVLIFHNSDMGEIIGDKIKTNLFLSEKGILCPKIITDKKYEGKVFVNSVGDSAAKTKVLKNGSKILDGYYNTEFIDTTFEYNSEKYYAAPRVMCVGKEIIEIQIRLRNVKEKNPNVHAKTAPMDSKLLNHYYENILQPRMLELEKICEKLVAVFGFGFYNHDFLISTQNNKIYLSETGYKFDNILWKKLTKPIVNELKSETDRENTYKKIFSSFEKELINSI